MKSYNKNDLAQLAAQTRFLRDNLEKVLRLTDVLQFIAANPKLSHCLVLKGGTAINLTVFAMPRLSVDIDLDYHSVCTREEMLDARLAINAEILAYMASQGYLISSGNKHPHSLDSWVFIYQNAAGNKDNIKIEINYSMRQHIYIPEWRTFKAEFLATNKVLTLAPMELFGSKIKALIERHTCRDLYDVFNLLHSDLFQTFDIPTLRKIVVFYLAVGGNKAPDKEYDLEPIRHINFSQIRASLLPMLKKGDSFNYEIAKKEVLLFLEELLCLTESEEAFVEAFNGHAYRPELLFDNSEMVDKIKNHPMAMWKVNRG